MKTSHSRMKIPMVFNDCDYEMLPFNFKKSKNYFLKKLL